MSNNYRLNYLNATTAYIAYSSTLKLVKVGCTKNLTKRTSSINEHQLGGVSDWQVITFCEIGKGNAGKLETHTHIELTKYRQPTLWHAKSEEETCKEVFQCSIEDAVLAMARSLRFCSPTLKAILQLVSCWGHKSTSGQIHELRKQHAPSGLVNICPFLWQNYGILPRNKRDFEVLTTT